MIEVLHNYGGKATNEKRIKPGVYDDDDEALFGLADYLVENGHAKRLTARDRLVHVVQDVLTGGEAGADEEPTSPESDESGRPVKRGRK